MSKLVNDLLALTKENRTGSYATQAVRRDDLVLIGKQLIEEGWYQLRASGITQRHVNRLVKRWKREGIDHDTIRNRLAHVRWVNRRTGNPHALPPTNDVYGLEPRHSVATESKAVPLDHDKAATIADPRVRVCLELQEAFGLRRDESLKLRPHQADQGLWLVMQGTWCKGNRPRCIPIRTAAQREVLERAKALVGKTESMIPSHLNLKQQRNRYKHAVPKARLEPGHSLRHQYAQDRYADLTGEAPPVHGGPALPATDPGRLILSAELGHHRASITRTYTG